MPSVERHTGQDYFNYFMSVLESNPGATLVDVAEHFNRGVTVVKTGLMNFLTSKRMAKQYGYLLNKMPERSRVARVADDTPVSDEILAVIREGITFTSLVEKFGGEGTAYSRARLLRAWQANKPSSQQYGRVGREAYDAWLAAGGDDGIADQPEFWSRVSKDVGARGPQYANAAAISYATKESMSQVPVSIGSSIRRLSAEDLAAIKDRLVIVSDEELAAEVGVAPTTVAAARRKLGLKLKGRRTDSDIQGERIYSLVKELGSYAKAAITLDAGLTATQLKSICADYSAANGLPVLKFRNRQPKSDV